MRVLKANWYLRSLLWFILAGSLFMGLCGASIISPAGPVPGRGFRLDPQASAFLQEINQLGFMSHASQGTIEQLIAYQRESGKSLGQILQEPGWPERLGFASTRFKATWYAANPFDLLPPDLRKAIKRHPTPFRHRRDLNAWLSSVNAPDRWRRAIRVALVETTASNLWRASRGLRPYAKNGQLLEPIVVEHDKGVYEVRHGHIATDPRVVPTNSEVVLLVKVNGEDKVLRVKASDIGAAVRGRHVDLPIYMKPGSQVGLPYIRFPKEYIRNPTVQILRPAATISRGRTASTDSL